MIIWHTSAFPSWYPKRVLRQIINKTQCFVQRRENQWRQRKQEGTLSQSFHSGSRNPGIPKVGFKRTDWAIESDQLCQKANVEIDEWMEGCLYVLCFCLLVYDQVPDKERGYFGPSYWGGHSGRSLGQLVMLNSVWNQEEMIVATQLTLSSFLFKFHRSPDLTPTIRMGLPFSVNALKGRPKDGSPRRFQMQSSWSQILIIIVCNWETNERGCQLISM